MEKIEISTTQFKRVDLVKVSGRIDSYTAPKLEDAFNELTGSSRFKIVFDMDEVEFVSSKGWWVLIDTQKKCKRYNRGELVLVNIDQRIGDSLNLIGLTDYFKIYHDLTEAVGSF